MSVRILIVNAVALNAGDAAILEGEVRALREAYGGDVRITIADDDPAAASRLYPDLDFVPGFRGARRIGLSRAGRVARSALRRRRELAVRLLPVSPALGRRLLDAEAREHLGRIAAADVVVATGGTWLVEHYPLGPRLRELRAALALGKPTYLYTQSMGPFTVARVRRRVGSLLRAVDHVFLRDERSLEHAAGLGVAPERMTVCPDAAFALAPREGDAGAPAAGGFGAAAGPGGTAAAAGAGPPERPLRVAISVREWDRFGDRGEAEGLRLYRESVASAVRRLRRRGAEVVFMSTCQGVERYWTDDGRFARDLVSELLPEVDGVEVDGAFRRPEELIQRLRGFDLAVATRMHFAILALCAGVPVVPIAYEFKTTELFRGLGMADLVEDIAAVTPEALEAKVEGALERLAELASRCREALPALREGAMEPARVIRRRHPPEAAGPGGRAGGPLAAEAGA